jgi:hypothetical protein
MFDLPDVPRDRADSRGRRSRRVSPGAWRYRPRRTIAWADSTDPGHVRQRCTDGAGLPVMAFSVQPPHRSKPSRSSSTNSRRERDRAVPAELGGSGAAGGSRWWDGLVDEEVLELGPRRPAPVRWLWILAIVLAVVGVTSFAVRRSAVSPAPRAATPSTVGTVSATVRSTGVIALPAVSQRPFPMDTAAVVLGEVPLFAAVERTDGAAAQGPWSLVVRRRDGSLGRHGAVITYPVSPPAWGHPVRVGRAVGTAVAGGFVWPLVGKYARIRSDLPPPDVVRLALATTVVSAVPAIHPVSGYWLVVAAPYRSGSIHEIRYHASQLGSAAGGLDGLIYTGLLSASGGFEDRLYARSATDAGQVHGRPAVATVTTGGNDVVAWEVAAGTIAYLGYSGAESGPHTVDVLRQLAGRARPLCGRHWRASSPQRTEQRNDFG